MSFIQREIDRINDTLTSAPDSSAYGNLYAAQQALSWVLEPSGVKSPFDLIMGIPANLEGCSDDCRPPQS